MVSIRETYTVKPASVTPSGRLYLSESDQSIPITYTLTIYIYRRPASSTQPFKSLVENLATSLSKVLVDFYPVAGRLHYIPNGGGRVELECNNEGVILIEAESELSLDSLGDFSPSPLVSSLIPRVEDYASKPIHERPLFLVQVTKFCCSGISLGLASSHSVSDGQASMFFMSEWSKHALGESKDPAVIVRPFLDRTILKMSTAVDQNDVYIHKDFSNLQLIMGRPDDTQERLKETVVAKLKLSIEQVEKLKYEANLSNRGERAFTRYEAIAAHMWRCASKARGHNTSQPTRLRIAMDFRNRLQPRLPPTFFGNAIIIIAIDATSGELLGNPIGYVSSKIRENLAAADNESVRAELTYVASQPDVTGYKTGFFGNPNFVVTSWLSLPMYRTDLGWGTEDYMGPGEIGQDGKSFILPDHETEGSVVVLLRLQAEHMNEFKKCFYEDICVSNL